MRRRFAISLALFLAAGCAREADDAAYGEAAAEKAHTPAPCALTGEATDGGEQGWAVHEAPDPASRVIGRLHPAMDPHSLFHDENPSLASGGVGPNFTIEAVSGEWLRIADIDPVTDGLDLATGLTPSHRNFQGVGWVDRMNVRLIFTSVAAHERPDPGSPRVEQANFWQGTEARFLLDCKGRWAQLEHVSSESISSRPVRAWAISHSNREHAESLRKALMAEEQTP